MATKMILIAAAQIRGGIAKGKGGEVERHVAEKGDHLTAAVLKKLGLGATDVDALTARGTIIERSALQADSDGESDLDLLSGAELEAVLLMRKVPIPAGSDKPALIALVKADGAA